MEAELRNCLLLFAVTNKKKKNCSTIGQLRKNYSWHIALGFDLAKRNKFRRSISKNIQLEGAIVDLGILECGHQAQVDGVEYEAGQPPTVPTAATPGQPPTFPTAATPVKGR